MLVILMKTVTELINKNFDELQLLVNLPTDTDSAPSAGMTEVAVGGSGFVIDACSFPTLPAASVSSAWSIFRPIYPQSPLTLLNITKNQKHFHFYFITNYSSKMLHACMH
jgi:hypothetical protein